MTLQSVTVARHCFICTVNLWADTAPLLTDEVPEGNNVRGSERGGRTGGAAAVTRHHGRSSCGFSPNAALWPVTYSMEMGETLGRPQNWLLRSQLQMCPSTALLLHGSKNISRLSRHSNMRAYLSSFINHTAPFHPPRKLKGCPMTEFPHPLLAFSTKKKIWTQKSLCSRQNSTEAHFTHKNAR